VFFFLAES